MQKIKRLQLTYVYLTLGLCFALLLLIIYDVVVLRSSANTVLAESQEEAEEEVTLSPIAQMAVSQIGYVPAEINATKYHDDLNLTYGSDWCGYFVEWVLEKTGNEDLIVDDPGMAVSWSQSGYVHSYNDGYIPQSGDIVTFDRDGNGNVDHVGIVEKYVDGVLYTVEGNTYPHGDETKDLGVFERVYDGSGWMYVRESSRLPEASSDSSSPDQSNDSDDQSSSDSQNRTVSEHSADQDNSRS